MLSIRRIPREGIILHQDLWRQRQQPTDGSHTPKVESRNTSMTLAHNTHLAVSTRPQESESRSAVGMRSPNSLGQTSQTSQRINTHDAPYTGAHGSQMRNIHDQGPPPSIKRYLAETDGLDATTPEVSFKCVERGERMTAYIDDWERNWRQMSDTVTK